MVTRLVVVLMATELGRNWMFSTSGMVALAFTTFAANGTVVVVLVIVGAKSCWMTPASSTKVTEPVVASLMVTESYVACEIVAIARLMGWNKAWRCVISTVSPPALFSTLRFAPEV